MAVSIVQNGVSKRLAATDYASEQELEDVIVAHPYLLTSDDEPDLVPVASQISFSEVGIADLMFLDTTGQITLVEVKLGRNSEIRRKVVGQVFDYVSTLADRTIVEVDELTSGGLEEALRICAENQEGLDYEDLRRICSTELRAGKVRVSIVTDRPSDGLVRIMSFLNDHSDLDVRLISVEKHELDGVIVYSPQSVIKAAEFKAVERRSAPKMSTRLSDIVEAFDRLRPQGLSTNQRSNAAGYRQIRIPDWPATYHYEVIERQSGVSIEFHQESASVGSLTEDLKQCCRA